jgi:hypothetical protein
MFTKYFIWIHISINSIILGLSLGSRVSRYSNILTWIPISIKSITIIRLICIHIYKYTYTKPLQFSIRYKYVPRRRWVDNIRMDLGEVGWGDVDCIGLARDRNRWRALVNSVLNLRVP